MSTANQFAEARRIRPAARPLPPVTLGPVTARSIPDQIIEELFNDLFAARGKPPTAGERLRSRGLRVAHIHPTGDPSDAFGLNSSVTVVYRPRYQDSHVLEYAISICSPGDTFSKKVGVKKALERWDAGRRSILPPRKVALSDHMLIETYFG